MKHFVKSAVAVGTVAIALLSAAGAQAASTTAGATASILSPVSVTKSADLAFGKIVAGAASSTVTLTSAGGFTCGTGLTCYGTHGAAAFNVAASSGETVTVAADSSVTLSDGGSNTMVATLSPSVTTIALTTGTGNFSVGGELTVGASQAAGAYAGTFAVTVDYQ